MKPSAPHTNPTFGDDASNLDGLLFNWRPAFYFGLATIMLMIVVVGGWSVFAPLRSGAVASGNVVVDTNRKQIQHLDGGTIASILVRDGDQVRAGDLLIELDPTELQSQYDQHYAEFLSILAKMARLDAEARQRNVLAFPEIFTKPPFSERKNALAALQNQLFQARQTARMTEIQLYHERISQYREQGRGLELQQAALGEHLALLASEIEGLEILFAKGITPKAKLMTLKREAAEIKRDQAQVTSSISETKLIINEIELNILSLQHSFAEEVINDLSAARIELNDVEERLNALGAQLKRTKITAPSEGVIFNSTVFTEGGVISPGDTVMEIVPLRDELTIEAKASPLDIDIIYQGLSAQVRFSALPSKETPVLTGTVLNVAPDITFNNDGQNYYVVKVGISRAERDRLGGTAMVPGMPVEVLIDKGEQTLVQYLADPISSLFFRALTE